MIQSYINIGYLIIIELIISWHQHLNKSSIEIYTNMINNNEEIQMEYQNNMQQNNKQLLQQKQQQMIKQLPSDNQFYERKIISLEDKLETAHKQLNNLKIKLRTTQDYQLKNQLLTQQLQNQTHKFINTIKQHKLQNDKLIQQLQQKDHQSHHKLLNKQTQLKKYYQELLDRVNRQNQSIKTKYQNIIQDNKLQIIQYKLTKSQQQKKQLQKQIETIQTNYQQKYIKQIQSIKENITNRFLERQQNDKKIYRDKIQQLQQKLNQTQQKLAQQQIKSNPNRQLQITKLNNQLINNRNQNNQEISAINTAYDIKFRNLEKILIEKSILSQDLQKQNIRLSQELVIQRTKYIKSQKQHQEQFLYLKQKMNQIKDFEVSNLKQQIKMLSDNIQNQRKTLSLSVTQKQQQIQRIEKIRDQERSHAKKQKYSLLQKIEQLKERLKIYEGQKQKGETDQMIQSMKNFTQKQNKFIDYDDGIKFLRRQIQKYQIKIKQKETEISNLLNQLNQMRTQFNSQQNQYKKKIKQDKQILNDKIIEMQAVINKLNNQNKQKQLLLRQKDREIQNQKAKAFAQVQCLKQINKQLQNDYNRIIQNKKDIEKSFREQRDKGIISKNQINNTKKTKWLELQRQKNQVQVIFKEKQDQLKISFELQIQKLRIERDNLKKENQIFKKQQQILAINNKQKKPIQDKYAEYNKKVATLNLQIALTQNIYDNIQQAKGKRMKTPLSMSSIKSQSQPMDSARKDIQLRQVDTPIFMKFEEKKFGIGNPFTGGVSFGPLLKTNLKGQQK